MHKPEKFGSYCGKAKQQERQTKVKMQILKTQKINGQKNIIDVQKKVSIFETGHGS